MKYKLANLIRYETFILIGILIVAGTFIKLMGFIDFSSDWFWLLAGIGLVIEGTISMIKQRKFDRKYKIIEVSKLEPNKGFK